MRDVGDDLAALRRRLEEAAGYLKVEDLRARRPTLEAEASKPDLWNDPAAARRVTSELAAVNDDLDGFDALAQRLEDAETLFELAREEGDDSVAAEIEGSLDALARSFDELELRSLFTGEYDQ